MKKLRKVFDRWMSQTLLEGSNIFNEVASVNDNIYRPSKKYPSLERVALRKESERELTAYGGRGRELYTTLTSSCAQMINDDRLLRLLLL
jgi:hypothetical protein